MPCGLTTAARDLQYNRGRTHHDEEAGYAPRTPVGHEVRRHLGGHARSHGAGGRDCGSGATHVATGRSGGRDLSPGWRHRSVAGWRSGRRPRGTRRGAASTRVAGRAASGHARSPDPTDGAPGPVGPDRNPARNVRAVGLGYDRLRRSHPPRARRGRVPGRTDERADFGGRATRPRAPRNHGGRARAVGDRRALRRGPSPHRAFSRTDSNPASAPLGAGARGRRARFYRGDRRRHHDHLGPGRQRLLGRAARRALARGGSVDLDRCRRRHERGPAFGPRCPHYPRALVSGGRGASLLRRESAAPEDHPPGR